METAQERETLEIIERLAATHTTPPGGKIALALSKAQLAFSPVVKDKIARINSSKGNYTYNYADLAAVFHSIREGLAANELAIVQATDLEDKGYVLKTSLIHSSGERLDSFVRLSDWPDPKALGIEMSYLRRYQICALVGVASEDDTDSDGLDQKRRPDKKPQPEALEQRGLNPELKQKLIGEINACEDSAELTRVYAGAYRTAQEAQDSAAAEEFLSVYRSHPNYVAPAAKKAVT